MVGAEFAYLVQTETIRSYMGFQNEPSTQKLRVTMVFRRERDGWRIVHRHADLQVDTHSLPNDRCILTYRVESLLPFSVT